MEVSGMMEIKWDEHCSEHMKVKEEAGVTYLSYEKFDEIPWLVHGFSTRLGGVSAGEFSTMNLALNRGDNREDVITNYKLFCNATGLDFNTLVASAQDHNTVVRKVTTADYGIGITGKLNRIDEANPGGNDSLAFVSIYDKLNDTFYNREVKAVKSSRVENKELILSEIIDMLLNII